MGEILFKYDKFLCSYGFDFFFVKLILGNEWLCLFIEGILMSVL